MQTVAPASRRLSRGRLALGFKLTDLLAILETVVETSTTRLVFDSGKVIEIAGPADITEESTEAIVNAANSSLLGGGGVDGAIHHAGGPEILAECRQFVGKIGRLPAGQAVITTGGRLAAKHVIHTVGPVYRGGDQGEAGILASCHRESLRLAEEYSLKSVSFPAISTGANGYPEHEAAPVALSAVIEMISSAAHVQLVRFVLFDISTGRAFSRAATKLSKTASSFHLEKVHS